MVPCPRCGHAVVIVPVRDPPPLYTWEVYPNLYGSAPMPRGNPYRWPPAIAALLWASAILLAGAAGTLAVVSGASELAGPGTLSGLVEEAGPNGSASVPLAGAQVHFTGDSGGVRLAVTDGAGRFAFRSVLPGGVALNVTYPGLTPAGLELFESPFYASVDPLHVAIVLGAPGSNASTSSFGTPFSNLESFVASLTSAALLLGIGAAVAAIGAGASARRTIGPGVPAAGVGAAIAPAALVLLGVFDPFPLLLAPAVVAVIFGGTAAGLAGTMRWLTAELGPAEPAAGAPPPAGRPPGD